MPADHGADNPRRTEGIICPACGSSRVYLAHRRRAVGTLLRLIRSRVHLCNSCGVRFARWAGHTIYIEEVERALRRIALIGVALIGTILVAMAIRWVTQGRHW